MPNKLITPSDLLVTDEGSQEDLRTRVNKLQSAARVLEQSIRAQQQVAASVENQPELYPVAIRVVEGLMDSHGQTLLQAALLDLQSLLGNELQVAMFLSQMAVKIRQEAQNQRQLIEQAQATAQTPDETTGTSVAKDEENAEATTADESDERVH